MTTYSISVQAAGCLPDSEMYPFTVEGIEAAAEAAADILDGIEDEDAKREQLTSELEAYGCAAVDMGGTYSLTVEEVVA